MATPEHVDRAAADRLDRFWDGLLGHLAAPPGSVHPGGPPSPDEDGRRAPAGPVPSQGHAGDLDPVPDRNPGPDLVPGRDIAPGLAAAVRRLHARDDAPAPDPAFALRLRRDLISLAALPVDAASAAHAKPASVAAPAPLGRGGQVLSLLPPLARRPLRELVAAALLLAVVGGSFGGRGLLPGLVPGSPTVAAQAAPASPPRPSCPASPTPNASPAATPPLGTPLALPCP